MVIFTRLIPFWLVGAYRAVPGSLRGSRVWPGHAGPSSSHWALDRIYQGAGGWSAIREALALNKPPWWDDY